MEVCKDVPSIVKNTYKSIYVPRGATVSLYSEEHYVGSKRTFKQSLDCDNNGLFILA